MKIFITTIFSVFMFLPNALAQTTEAPVFETTVTTEPLKSSSRKVFTQKEIAASGAVTVVQLLTEQAGLTVTNSAFAPNALYMRGGDAGHIIFLIDGFPVYDAISDKRTFNLNSINLAAIKKIEVINGSQTALYGGQALAGVVKIETVNLNPEQKDLKLKLLGGDHENLQGYLNWQKLNTDLTSAPQLGVFYRQRTNDSPLMYSDYKYPEKQLAGDAAWLKRVSEKGAFLIRARVFDDKKDIINRNRDAKNFESKNSHALVGASWSSDKNQFLPSLNVTYVETSRSYYHPVNALNTSLLDQDFNGRLVNVRLEQPVFKNNKLEFLAGASWAKEEGEIINVAGQNPALNGRKDTFTQELSSLFARANYIVADDFSIDLGARNEKIPTKTGSSFQVGTSIHTWRLEYATGMKAPTLFNLYDFQYGYSELKPETAQTLTVEKKWEVSKDLKLSATGFYSKYDDLIDAAFTPSGLKYQNVFEAEILGVEGQAKLQLPSGWRWQLTALYQDPKDLTRNRRLYRRPYHTASAQLSKEFNEKWQGYLTYYASGDRIDFATSTRTATLRPYELTGLGLQYVAQDNLKWNLKTQNLFDKRYQESYSYYSDGFSVLLGMEYEN